MLHLQRESQTIKARLKKVYISMNKKAKERDGVQRMIDGS
jgi:hypothetical protein